MIRRPPKSPLFPYTPLFRSIEIEVRAIELGSERSGDRRVAGVHEEAREVHLRGARREVVAQVLQHEVRPRDERSEEHTSELQSQSNLVCRLLLEKKKKKVMRRREAEYTVRAAIPAREHVSHETSPNGTTLAGGPLAPLVTMALAVAHHHGGERIR